MPVVRHTKNHTRSRALGKLFVGASSLAIAAALAAPALAADSGGIETVVVTAQFTETNVQATPLAVSVVTADDLEQKGVFNISQLSATVPSLTLNPTPAAFGNGLQAFIRGVGAFDTAFEHEPGVGTYIDDIYFGTLTGSQLDLMDLNRVEVLRGPQGVLGGKNDIGGAIKLFSQKPTDDNSGYFEGTYGSYNELYIKGAANFTIIPDQLYLRASVMSKHQDGYVEVIDYRCAFGAGNGPTGAGGPTATYPGAQPLPSLTNQTDCKLGTQGGTDTHGGRLALRWVHGDHMEDTFSADIVRDDSEVAPDTLYAVYAQSTNPAPLGTVYFNNGHGLQSVNPVTFFGSAAGAAGANPGLVQFAWNGDFNGVDCSAPGAGPASNCAKFGIPWDQVKERQKIL